MERCSMHVSTAVFQNEQGYLELLKKIWYEGFLRGNRTGIQTKALLSAQVGYNLSDGMIPIFTTKKVYYKSVAVELEWFLSGSDNIRFLEQNKCSIWTEWPFKAYLQKMKIPLPAQNSFEWKERIDEFRYRIVHDEEFAQLYGSIGTGAYGSMWRAWPDGERRIDQLQTAIDKLRKNPFDRRAVVVAYNPAEEQTTLLPPCHSFFQFMVDDEGGLVCALTQRSADMFLGVPFNVASYAMLTHIIARILGLVPRAFEHSMGDCHIYCNHEQAVLTQLSRKILRPPTLILPEITDLSDFKWEMIAGGIRDYQSGSSIKADVAI